VRILRPSDEAEVVDVFVRGERESRRWGDRVRELEERGLTGADLLAEHRGWGRDVGLFAGFPASLAWFLASLSRDEVLDILYIDWDWWLKISGGTRQPRVAAERIHAGLVPGVEAKSEEPLARSAGRNPPLIAVRTSADSPLVLLEGHVRLTAYALYPEHVPNELEAFVGESAAVAGWSEWGLG
jgi:hypothetical protein